MNSSFKNLLLLFCFAASAVLGQTRPVDNSLRINGVSVTGTPSAGQIIKATGPKAATWQAAPTGSTNLSSVSGPSSISINSDTGTDVVISGATSASAGAMSAADKAKVDALGSAAYLNVPFSGNASIGEAVRGTDTRLGDQRIPVDGSVTDAKINGTLSQLKITNLTLDLSSKVPNLRTLSINGVPLDLSQDRSWLVPTVLTGTVAPTNGVGNNGDVYINTATSTFYGPKASGTWPAGVSLIGAQGSQGIQGIQGVAGATPTFTIGTITTGAPGTNAVVVLGGTSTSPTLSFTLPQGATGASGSGSGDMSRSVYDTDANNVVDNSQKIGGVTVTGTPSTGQVITATGPTSATWSTPSTSGTATAGTSYTNIINAAAAPYNIVADGFTDNATGLMLLRSTLAGANKPHYDAYMPGPGTILTSNNRWAYAIKDADFFLNGSTIKTIYSGTDDALARPLNMGELFQNNVLSYIGTKTYNPSHLFGTVTAGSRSLTLTTTSEISNYSAGKRVFLWHYDQVGNGAPPGVRFYEWHVVESVNAGTGVITLQKPLRYSYNTAVWDVPGILGAGRYSGKPRIYPLDDNTSNYAKHIGIHNGTLGDATGGNANSPVVIGAEDLVLDDVKTETGWVWASENRTVLIENTNFNGSSELDKLVGSVKYKNSSFKGQVSGASGVEYVSFEDCDLAQSLWIAPRAYQVKRTRLRGDTQPTGFHPINYHPAYYPIREVVLDQLDFSVSSSYPNTTLIDLGLFQSLSIPVVSGTDIKIPNSSFSEASMLAVRTMEIGTRVFKQEGDKGGFVTNISYDAAYNSGQGAYVISGTWPAPVVGETWKWSNIKNVIDKGNHTWPATHRLWNESSQRWAGNQSSGVVKQFRLTQRDVKWTAGGGAAYEMPLYGRIESIEIRVNKKYSGTTCMLSVNQVLTGNYNQIFNVNLMQEGYRRLDQLSGSSGIKTGELHISDTWTASTAYTAGRVLTVVPGGTTANRVYQVITGGTSSGTTPTDVTGNNFSNGTTTLKYLGSNALYSGAPVLSINTYSVSGAVGLADLPDFEILFNWRSY
ncbi:hypothetical protein [Spirosoma fluminis]